MNVIQNRKFTLFLLITLFLIFIYTLSKLFLISSTEKNSFYSLFLFIEIILFLLICFTIKLGNNFYQIFKIVIISILFSIYLFEITFDYLQNLKRKNDNVEKLENIYLKQSKKEKISLQLSPNMFLNDENNDLLPLSGFPLMKTLMCNENGKSALSNE